MNKRLVRTVKSVRPDFCMVIGGHRILRETVLAIKEQKIKIFLWTTDVPLDFSNILRSAIFYDHIFCSGTEAVELIKDKYSRKTELLPFACDPGLHHPVCLTETQNARYSSDVVFVGSYYTNRQKVLESLTDFDLSVWGPGWENLSKDSPLREKIKGGRVNYDEWVKIYGAAKIVLAVHFQNNAIPSKQISPKVFETMACRKPVFSDKQEDVRILFKEGENIICFEDEADLKEKLNFYLLDDQKRSGIAEAGYQEVISKHKYTDRIKVIIDKFKEIR